MRARTHTHTHTHRCHDRQGQSGRGRSESLQPSTRGEQTNDVIITSPPNSAHSRQLHKEEAARNEVEAKLNAATETLDEKEKHILSITAQKDAEIYRLSEEV